MEGYFGFQPFQSLLAAIEAAQFQAIVKRRK